MKRVTVLVLAMVMLMAMVMVVGCSSKPTQDQLQGELEKAQVDSDTQGAIKAYGKIVKYYPESQEAAKAQFMIGYLYSNELSDTSNARKAFQLFLDRYAAVSDSQLVLSAKMEMQTLGEGVDAYEKMIFKDKEENGAKKEESSEPVE